MVDDNFLKKNKVPLLYSDASWIQLFAEVGDKNINSAREDLMSAVEEERKAEEKVGDLQKEKLKSMKMILGVSDSINNDKKAGNVKLLDQYKNRIEQINKELEDLQFLLETTPKKIREANLRLLNATIEYGYKELNKKEKTIEEAKSEIDILRKRLKELIITRHDAEDWVNKTYNFFHGLLGSEVINFLDMEKIKK